MEWVVVVVFAVVGWLTWFAWGAFLHWLYDNITS